MYLIAPRPLEHWPYGRGIRCHPAVRQPKSATRDADCLKEALTEATSGTTSINGGLVLSNMIAVGGNGNALRAGMLGTSQASDGKRPMIWAGSSAATDDGIDGAAFRVYNSGQVYMDKATITTSGTEGSVRIDAGEITVAKTNGAMTTITSKAMGDLEEAINNAGGDGRTDTLYASCGSVTTTATAQSFSYGGYVARTVTKSTSTTTTLTLYNSAPFSGYVSIAKTYTVKGNPSISLNASKADSNKIIDGSLGTMSGSDAKFTMTATTAGSVTINAVYKNGTAVSATNGQYPIVKGAKYTIAVVVYAAVTFSVIPTVNYGNISSWICYCDYDCAGTNATATLTCTATSTEYVNKYYADGFMIFNNEGTSVATQYYAGMTSASSDVMRLGSGNALLKFGTDGLMQSLNGGSTYYRANPLYCAFKLVYKSATSTGYACTWVYNPKGLTLPTATRNSAGNITITHNLALSSYYPQGAYVCTGTYKHPRTLMFDNISTNSLQIHLKNGDTSYDPYNTGGVDYFVIYIYDFGTY